MPLNLYCLTGLTGFTRFFSQLPACPVESGDEAEKDQSAAGESEKGCFAQIPVKPDANEY